MSKPPITVIGAGLAGSEAAWQIAQQGIPVNLYEMRPVKQTPAHQTNGFAELVCSNSFGSDGVGSAPKMLKEELKALEAFVLGCARSHQVPAGNSLAVDRVAFSQEITQRLSTHPLIHIHREEITQVPEEGIVVVATGPLTSDSLARDLSERVGQGSLYFYDAISPIVAADSLDMSVVFKANRYGKGDTQDFLNIPLSKEEYETLIDDLLTGEVVLPHDFEEEKYFEGCMPVEAIAARGRMTLAFGPMRPVGLTDPRTGKRPFAVIQLRTENAFFTAYNLVGFQTKLKYGEQKRIFSKLPGLTNAEFLRLGCMHRNTYFDSPRVLHPTLQFRRDTRVFLAGQLTGTEGYLESSATGWVAGFNAARLWKGQDPVVLPSETVLGALLASITDEGKTRFQPMNSNLGILPPLEVPVKDKRLRGEAYAVRSAQKIEEWKTALTLAQGQLAGCEVTLSQNHAPNSLHP
jgi:methylenetetrahydrofolate--tRNA-(uracil-5-)-methyltransferase